MIPFYTTGSDQNLLNTTEFGLIAKILELRLVIMILTLMLQSLHIMTANLAMIVSYSSTLSQTATKSRSVDIVSTKSMHPSIPLKVVTMNLMPKIYQDCKSDQFTQTSITVILK